MVTLTRTVAPDSDVFTAQQLMDQLRISVPSSADASNLKAYLDAATEWVEGVAGCSAMKQTWVLGLDTFPFYHGRDARRRLGQRDFYYLPRPILLPRGPLIAVTKIEYMDTNGANQTLDPSGYMLSKNEKPPAIYPPYAGYFPQVRYQPDSVRVTYDAGMGWDAADAVEDADQVSAAVKMAVKFLTAHWYINREPVPVDVKPEKLPYGLEAMLWSARIYRFDWQEYYSR